MKNNLTKFMQAYGVTQTKLAEKTGLSRQYINRLANQKSDVDPQQSSMLLIADALGASVYDIFFNPNVQLVLQSDKEPLVEKYDNAGARS